MVVSTICLPLASSKKYSSMHLEKSSAPVYVGSWDHALYALDRAVRAEELALPAFLKIVRKQSRRQFICKALIERIYDEQRRAHAAR